MTSIQKEHKIDFGHYVLFFFNFQLKQKNVIKTSWHLSSKVLVTTWSYIRNAGSTFVLAKTKPGMPKLTPDTALLVSGLDWDPFRDLAISGRKRPMDPHGKVTTHFRIGGVWGRDPLEIFWILGLWNGNSRILRALLSKI